jgi:glycosyltransferase involved in cell wall biosynthesis
MIVKNEEKVLRRCLASVRDLVDEMIIVDTGSTDSTKAIAYEFTSNVYDFEWVNDFSAAKNEAIRKAKGKWILVLDADEYVQPEGKEELKRFLSGLDPKQPIGFLLPIVNFVGAREDNKTMESYAARLFPNHPDLYYTSPIHEQLTYRHGELKHQRYDFYIFHTGYTDEVRLEKDKSKRNLSIFQSLKNKNAKLDAYYDFTLANEYSAIRDNKRALYYYERAYKKAKKDEIWFIHCMSRMINVLFSLDRYKDAYDRIEEAIGRWGRYADFYCFKGFMLEKFGMYEQAIAVLEQCLEIAREQEKNNKQFWLVSAEYGSSYPHQKLAEIYLKLQNIPKTVYHLTKLVRMNSRDFASLYKLIHLMCQSESFDSVVGFLSRLLPEHEGTNLSILCQISLHTGNGKLAEYYMGRCRVANIPLSPSHLLRYAVVANNKPLFDDTLATMDAPAADEGNRLSLYLAAYIWKHPAYLDFPNDSMAEFLKTVMERRNVHAPDQVDVPTLVQMLIQLFKAGYYDEYDSLLKYAESRFADVANEMGHYFFSHNQIELAVDYYALLIDAGLLQAAGYENLSLLYLNQGMNEDGLSFLKKAIEKNPRNPALYVRFCLHCSSEEERRTCKEKLIDQFPQYKQLPFIKSL